jgi:hypothetical protein
MDIETIKRETLPNIDGQTLRWLSDFCARKRRKLPPESFGADDILAYMDTHAVDYYFIQRNYTHLNALLSAYVERYGRIEAVDRLIADL